MKKSKLIILPYCHNFKDESKKVRENTDQERIDMMAEHYGYDKTVDFL